MTDAPRLARAKQIEHAAREARLARALRENLRRRKEQARARQLDVDELIDKPAPEDRPPG